MRVFSGLLFILLLGVLSVVGCGEKEPEGPYLAYSPGRGDWLTSEVTATVREARGVDGVELTVQIEARHRESGEQLSFLAVVPQLEGRHPVQIYGRLAGFDSQKGYERLLPISSACSASDESAVLIIDAADPAERRLEGRFLAHVCGVESDHTWTLGEGRFSGIPY